LVDKQIKTDEQSRKQLETLIKQHLTDVDNFLQVTDSDNDQLNDDVYEVGDNNIKINEFCENIKISVQSTIRVTILTIFIYLNRSIIKNQKRISTLDSSVYSFIYKSSNNKLLWETLLWD